MSSHTGVSCDVCLKTNFSDRRYKCLICDNYDLCGLCHDVNGESQHHRHTHAMQCILTKTAYELFYAGEAIPHRSIVSLTCPYCAESGFLPRTLFTHCLEKHPMIGTDNQSNPLVMCPICVILPSQDYQARFVSLADHLAREHEGADAPPASSISQIRSSDNKREFVEHDDDDDDDEGVPLYILAERLFLKEETRRQDYSTLVNQQRTSQRRALSRQVALRGSRAIGRGHLNHTPYSTIVRAPIDTSVVDSRIFSESYADLLYSQNSIFEFGSPLSSFLNDESHYLATTISSQIPSTKASHYHEQNETNDRMIQKRSNLTTVKQKRLCHHPTQSSFQTVVAPSSFGADHPLWHDHFPPLPSTSNNQTNSVPITADNRDPLNRELENDPRSLIGKLLKTIEPPIRHSSDQDHLSFFKSLLFSTIHFTNPNKDQLC